jgi:hypothetical protein
MVKAWRRTNEEVCFAAQLHAAPCRLFSSLPTQVSLSSVQHRFPKLVTAHHSPLIRWGTIGITGPVPSNGRVNARGWREREMVTMAATTA